MSLEIMEVVHLGKKRFGLRGTAAHPLAGTTGVSEDELIGKLARSFAQVTGCEGCDAGSILLVRKQDNTFVEISSGLVSPQPAAA